MHSAVDKFKLLSRIIPRKVKDVENAFQGLDKRLTVDSAASIAQSEAGPMWGEGARTL